MKNKIDSFINSHTPLYGWKHLIHRTRFKRVMDIVNPKKDELILDIGCSGGQYTYEFAKKGAKAVGIDIVQNKKPNYGVKVEFIEGSIYELPYEDNSVDKAFLSEMIITLDKPLDALKEVNRVLKKDGKLILSNSNGYKTFEEFFQKDSKYPFIKKLLMKKLKIKSEQEFLNLHREILDYLGVNPKHSRNFSIEQTKELLKQSNFNLKKIHFEFRKNVSTLMAFLLIYRYTFGTYKNKKILTYTFWSLFPLFVFLEKIDSKPGSGVIYECIKTGEH